MKPSVDSIRAATGTRPMFSCMKRLISCGFFPFIETCYQTTVPHVVSVTWPDGHDTHGIQRHIEDLKAMFVYAPVS